MHCWDYIHGLLMGEESELHYTLVFLKWQYYGFSTELIHPWLSLQILSIYKDLMLLLVVISYMAILYALLVLTTKVNLLTFSSHLVSYFYLIPLLMKWMSISACPPLALLNRVLMNSSTYFKGPTQINYRSLLSIIIHCFG